MNEIYYSERNKRLFKNAPTHSNQQQLAAPLERFCAKLLGDCKEFDPETFSCTTSRYLLGRHLKVSGALCILLVIFVGIYCFRRKKCASDRITFDSSPIFEISSSAALLNTLYYPYNRPEHRRNASLALYLAQG